MMFACGVCLWHVEWEVRTIMAKMRSIHGWQTRGTIVHCHSRRASCTCLATFALLSFTSPLPSTLASACVKHQPIRQRQSDDQRGLAPREKGSGDLAE